MELVLRPHQYNFHIYRSQQGCLRNGSGCLKVVKLVFGLHHRNHRMVKLVFGFRHVGSKGN